MAMKTFLMLLTGLAMLATLGVLFAGMVGLARSGGDAMRSNRLMRYRVLFQALALALFGLMLLLARA